MQDRRPSSGTGGGDECGGPGGGGEWCGEASLKGAETWGYVPMAEPDPWDMPSGASPNEWPYDFWIDVTRRQNQRQRRGPCGSRLTSDTRFRMG